MVLLLIPMPVFHKAGDYQAFLDLLIAAKRKYPVKVFGFCLMPNHFRATSPTRRPQSLHAMVDDEPCCPPLPSAVP